MSVSSIASRSKAQKAEHFDVLIVGAGISGVGGAYHLTTQCPAQLRGARGAGQLRRHLVTHRYPGIRSDSDLYTFGYRFKPWIGRRSRPPRRS
jgi:cation diffusion facilitator CzcD-associated flavoprotein CzcO